MSLVAPRSFLKVVILPALVASALRAQPQAPVKITGDVVPAAEWQQVATESVGYSSAKLEALRDWVKTQDTGSVMVIVQGRVIFSYGDVSHTSKIASVRKSVLGMLYVKICRRPHHRSRQDGGPTRSTRQCAFPPYRGTRDAGAVAGVAFRDLSTRARAS